MRPTKGEVFVEKAASSLAKGQFDIVDSAEAQWQVSDVSEGTEKCRVGDYILFDDCRNYKFDGKDIYIVKEANIRAVKTNSELKK